MTVKFSGWDRVETQCQEHEKGESRDLEHSEQWTGTWHWLSKEELPAPKWCGRVRNPGSLAWECVLKQYH